MGCTRVRSALTGSRSDPDSRPRPPAARTAATAARPRRRDPRACGQDVGGVRRPWRDGAPGRRRDRGRSRAGRPRAATRTSGPRRDGHRLPQPGPERRGPVCESRPDSYWAAKHTPACYRSFLGCAALAEGSREWPPERAGHCSRRRAQAQERRAVERASMAAPGEVGGGRRRDAQ
jgi:hypothetical protein